MHAQLITYTLKGISEAEYVTQMVEPDSPILAQVPGLHSKVWLASPGMNTYGGFYLWRDRTDMDAFMASDLVAAVVARPFLGNIAVSDYAVVDGPSRITRGLGGS